MKDTFIQFHSRGVFFRVLGYGLALDLYSTPSFSERIKIKRPLFRFNKICLRILRP